MPLPGAIRSPLSLGRIVAKAIHVCVAASGIVCVLCWRVLPEIVGWRFWIGLWLVMVLLTEPIAIGLYLWSRGSSDVSMPAAEWLRAVSLAALPCALLLSFWLLMWATFGGIS
jgi:hypothetical protein